MRKCIMVFFLQIFLITLFYIHMQEEELGSIPRPKFQQMCARLMCAFIMHLFIIPEVRQGLSIIRFLKYTTKPEYLRGRFTNFLVAMMKLSSSLYCEVILTLMIAEVDSVSDIIKDFVALGFIIEIDNYFANNLDKYGGYKELVEKFNEEGLIEANDMHKWLIWEVVKAKVRGVQIKQESSDSSDDYIAEEKEGKYAPENWTWLDIIEDCVICLVYTVINEFYTIVYYYLFFFAVVELNFYFYDDAN